jgi:hypothetical protein
MNPTKHSFLLPMALWVWNFSNAATCRSLMMLGYYHLIMDLQNKYIRHLERYNDYTQSYIAQAYIRVAAGHFAKGEYLQTIDRCMMAIYTYGYNSGKAYRLCAKAYQILAINIPDLNRNVFWENEILEENKLLNQ